MPEFAVSTRIGAMDRFSSAFASFHKNVKQMGDDSENHFGRARKAASLFGQVFTGVFAGGLALKGLSTLEGALKALPEFAERGEQIGRTAKTIGITTDELQRLNYVASQTGTPTDAVANAMEKLNKNMAQLTVGKGTLMDLLHHGPPGLAQMIRGTHNTTEAMLMLADAFQKNTDPQVRAMMATSAFGKAGQALIPMLSQGRAKVEALMKEASLYGDVLDENTIAASEKFAQSQKKVSGLLMTLRDKVLGQLMVKIEPLIEKFLKWYEANKDIISQRIDQVFTTIGDAIRTVVTVWNTLNDAFGGHLAKDILVIAAAWKAVQVAIMLASAAQTAFNLLSGKGGVPGVGGLAGAAEGAGGAGAIGGAGALAALAIPVAAGAAMMAITTLANKDRMARKAAGDQTIAAQDAANPYMFMQSQGAFRAPGMANNVNVPVTVNNSSASPITTTVRTPPGLAGNAGANN